MAFDDERSDIQMAVRSLDESNRLFAVEVDMENRSPEEIAGMRSCRLMHYLTD